MVVSGGSSSGRGLGIDRFYSPPAVRRQLEQQRQQRLQETGLRTPVNPKSRPVTPSVEPSPAVDVQEDESRVEFEDSSKPSVSSSSSASTSPSPSPPPTSTPPVTNFHRFLECTTPVVPARYSPKTILWPWRVNEDAECPFFILGDLWESFKECSAYGAGVPLVLNGCDCVVQYYVPYLSAIQIYMDSSKASRRLRQPGAECDNHALGGENATQSHALPPVFEYLEHDPPYGREPLADKISLLASKFPQLRSYRSCDLLPSSWISVAWYPIYRIPTGPTLRDLDACFLTFHSLSSTPIKNPCNGMPAELQLPVFGLASYKLKGPVWTNNGIHERQHVSFLLQAAEKWLHLLKVDHPDFRFFVSHHAGSLP